MRRIVVWALAAGVVAAWFATLRPQSLGGPADYGRVSGISMTPTMANGDLGVVEKQSRYGAGEIIVFRVPAGEPHTGLTVIHRIVGDNGTSGFVTKGDHNALVDPWHPTNADVLEVWLVVPGVVGWVVIAVLAAAVILLLVDAKSRRR